MGLWRGERGPGREMFGPQNSGTLDERGPGREIFGPQNSGTLGEREIFGPQNSGSILWILFYVLKMESST